MFDTKMGVLKRTLLLAVIGSLVNVDQVGGLCTDMQGTCEERGRDTHNRLLSHPDADHRHCEVLLTILGCIEEYLCTCNVTITAKLDQTFIDTANEYLGSCNNVSSHNARQSTRLKCMDGQPLPANEPDDPAVELEVDDTINRADIEALDSRLLQECQPYAQCSEVYHNAVQVASYIHNAQQRLASLCMANRLNLVCMSDAFCACREGDNELLRKTMQSIRVGHESNCQEQISEPIMQCTSSAASFKLMPTSLFLLATAIWTLASGDAMLLLLLLLLFLQPHASFDYTSFV